MGKGKKYKYRLVKLDLKLDEIRDGIQSFGIHSSKIQLLLDVLEEDIHKLEEVYNVSQEADVVTSFPDHLFHELDDIIEAINMNNEEKVVQKINLLKLCISGILHYKEKQEQY